ncbi:MAG: amidohydrolase family protein [bacterium]
MANSELIKKLVNAVNKKPKHNIIINAHMHIWNFDCIPVDFQNRYQGIPGSFDIVHPLLKVFKNIYKKEDALDKTLDFLEICRSRTLEDMVKVLMIEGACLDPDIKLIFTPLMMDMEYAVKDPEVKPRIPFPDQMRKTKDIVLKYPGRFLPFIAADPRRIRDFKNKGNPKDPHGIKYIQYALETKGFWGVKIYPPLGYKPTNLYLLPLYDYCEEKEIPITAHCNFGGLYSAQGKSAGHYKSMANPKNWAPVLKNFPNLKLNLGHFGGDLVSKKGAKGVEWHKTIIGYFDTYPNVYADISYHEAMFKNHKKYFTRLEKYSRKDQIWKKILYGTDWWVNRLLCKEWIYLDMFLALSGKYGIKKKQVSYILNRNAVNFLGLNNNSYTNGPLVNHVKFLAKNKKRLPPWFKFS